jgi:nucleotide-binding universal stress UspA family protein
MKLIGRVARGMHGSVEGGHVMRFKRILVPTDFGWAAKAALDAAIGLAQDLRATIVLMHVYGIPTSRYASTHDGSTADYAGALEHAAREELNRTLAAQANAEIAIAAALYSGSPVEQILLAQRQHDIDIIVMGTHGRSRVAQAFLGSVADKVVRQSPVPVLTVRPSPRNEAQDAPVG